jgi:hypothetical protein
MNNTSYKSLYVFVFVQIINTSALLVDYILFENKQLTITELSVKRPVLCVGIIIFEIISPVSLAIHLYYS